MTGMTGKKVSLVPQSAGAGLGQQTGGNSLSDGREARTLLAMIAPVGRETVREIAGDRAAQFVADLVEQSNATVTHFTVTGKQLFYLRDIKDKLVDKGVL